MKSASGALITLLNSSTEFIFVDLFTFTFADASVARYTSADINIVYGGNTFFANSAGIIRGKTKTIIGIEVDTLDVKLFADASVIAPGGLSWPAFASGGGFSGATLKLERAFSASGVWGDTTAGTVILFLGRVSTIKCLRTEVDLTIKSELETLNVNIPRNTFQPTCVHSLYDTGCTLNKASFTSSASCNGGSTTTLINTTLTQANGYFDQGVILFTSGANSGLFRTVKSYLNSSGQITVVKPFPSAPLASDAFNIYPGCDKTKNTCNAKFSNVINFRGYPFIPVPETSY